MPKATKTSAQEHRLLRLKKRRSKLHFKRGFLEKELQATEAILATVELRMDRLGKQLHSESESKNEIHNGDPSLHVS